MKKLLIPLLCLCAALGMTACSSPEDEETGRIEQYTDEVARDATDAIHKPLNKARGIQDIARQRNEEFALEDGNDEEEW